jgi:hypothetical protein
MLYSVLYCTLATNALVGGAWYELSTASVRAIVGALPRSERIPRATLHHGTSDAVLVQCIVQCIV